MVSMLDVADTVVSAPLVKLVGNEANGKGNFKVVKQVFSTNEQEKLLFGFMQLQIMSFMLIMLKYILQTKVNSY